MAEIKKYLDTAALGTLVDQIKAEDAKALQSAKDYADGLAKNYDATGSAATAEANAKSYADTKVSELANGQVKTNKEAIDGIVADYLKSSDKEELQGAINAVDSIADKNAEDIAAINNAETGLLKQAKDYTDTEVAEVQGEVDNLKAYVGTIPEGATSTNVVAYVQEKTAGIATSENLQELTNRVAQAEKDIDAIEADYLVEADKTEVVGLVNAEKERAMGVEGGLETRLAAVEADYLVEADKTELATSIKTNADAIDAIEADYLKAADKEEVLAAVNTEKERAMGVEGGLEGRIETMEAFWEAAQADGTDVNVIDTLKEIQEYIASDESGASAMAASIKQNSDDIDALEGRVDVVEDKLDTVAEGAQVNVIEVVKVNGEALTITDKAVDVIVPTGALASKDKVAEADLESALATKINGKADQTALDAVVEDVEALQGADEAFDERLQLVEAQLGDGENSVSDLIDTAKQEAIDAAAADATTKANQALEDAKTYTDGEIDKVEETIATLEGVVNGKAAQADLTALTTRVGTLETEMDTAQADIDAVEALAAANKAAHEANAAAIALKASQADLEAAVARIATNEGAISTLNETVADKADADDLDAAVARIAANETAIAENKSAINSFTAITSDEVNALFA